MLSNNYECYQQIGVYRGRGISKFRVVTGGKKELNEKVNVKKGVVKERKKEEKGTMEEEEEEEEEEEGSKKQSGEVKKMVIK